MELKLVRLYKKEDYTIGNLYIDGVLFCQTVEDKDRGLKNTDTLGKINKTKIYGKTAIPTGVYTVALTFSTKFKKTLPEVKNVPGWSGVRIHSGNTAADSLGCVIVGENKIKGGVINSRETMEKLMAKLRGQQKIKLIIE